MHASAGALAAAQPAGAGAMHREGLGRARAAQLSAQLMTEHVAVAALRGEVASSEHALLAQRQRHAAELAAEQSVRAQQTEQLMAMHQAASALGSVASSAFTLWLHDTYDFMGIDTTAHSVLGVLVSFLAVFRTQQAYSRYWEGRGHLGSLGEHRCASPSRPQPLGTRPQTGPWPCGRRHE